MNKHYLFDRFVIVDERNRYVDSTDSFDFLLRLVKYHRRTGRRERQLAVLSREQYNAGVTYGSIVNQVTFRRAWTLAGIGLRSPVSLSATDQVAEDTCETHGTFCCEMCFDVN
jgi:hypothetical protein